MPNGEQLTRIETVFQKTFDQDPSVYRNIDPTDLKSLIGSVLNEAAVFEEKARQPLHVKPEVAANIGYILLFSGTGDYDKPFQEKENAAYVGMDWMGGQDRQRMGRATELSVKVALAHSSQTVPTGGLDTLKERKATTKELLKVHGPQIVYCGYDVETAAAESLLDDPRIVIPRERVTIMHKPLKNTADQVALFAHYINGTADAQGKDVAIVTHGSHMPRVLRILDKHPLTAAGVVYAVPVATLAIGIKAFGENESMGVAGYVYRYRSASTSPYPYKMLPGD